MILTPVALLKVFKKELFLFHPWDELSSIQFPPQFLNFLTLSRTAISPSVSFNIRLLLWEYLEQGGVG